MGPIFSGLMRKRKLQSRRNSTKDLRLSSQVIAVGLLANTCIESTSRFAMEPGYHVTLVSDATAAFSHEMMHAAHHLNGPTFAHTILTTQELLAAGMAAGRCRRCLHDRRRCPDRRGRLEAHDAATRPRRVPPAADDRAAKAVFGIRATVVARGKE